MSEEDIDVLKLNFMKDFNKLKENTNKTMNLINKSKNNNNPKKNNHKKIAEQKKENSLLILNILKNIAKVNKVEEKTKNNEL